MLGKELQGHTTEQLGSEVVREIEARQARARGAKPDETTGRLHFPPDLLEEKYQENEKRNTLTAVERAGADAAGRLVALYAGTAVRSYDRLYSQAQKYINLPDLTVSNLLDGPEQKEREIFKPK